ncbi:hypothetical protein ACLMJK_007959 [Lecanora helva]
MDDILNRLEKDYCPPIDSSLFSAIISDYDLSNTASLNELRATLDILKNSALEEENTTFDPSGSSGIAYEGSSSDSSERARSWHGDDTSTATEETQLTGLSQGLANIDLVSNSRFETADPEREQYKVSFEELPSEDKIRLLKEMFPNAKDFDISYTLKKARWSFGKTVEELLNQAFLDSDDFDGDGCHRKKGVEAFTEPTINKRARRGRKKQKQLQRRTSSTPASAQQGSANYTASPSRWDRAKEDIDFISQRIHVSPQVITSFYHKNGASLTATIAAICASNVQEINANPYLVDASPSTLDAHAAELAIDFPHLLHSQLASLIALTYPSTASAHELARALSARSNSDTAKIIPQYRPRPPSPTFASSPIVSARPSLPFDQSTATTLAISRSSAFAQAQSSYRKSKSDRLMGGAAAYYSSVGRDASASLRRHQAAAAEAHVTGQSKPGEVDLHGVTVKDAVTIARIKVESWWDREGREWTRQGKVMGGGLRVITGAGRHSEGGRGKLGPAVGAMLVREGWKVEIGDGVIEVVGRARK